MLSNNKNLFKFASIFLIATLLLEQLIVSIVYVDAEAISLSIQAPTNLQVKRVASTSIFIDWDTSDLSYTYNVYRSLSSGVTSDANVSSLATPDANLRIATNVTSTEYDDSGLSLGVTYFYRVSAVKDGLESYLSNEVSAKTRTSGGSGNAMTLDDYYTEHPKVKPNNYNNNNNSGSSSQNSSQGSSNSTPKVKVNSPLSYDKDRDLTFSDVDSKDWSYKYINALKKYKNKLGQYVVSGLGHKEDNGKVARFAPELPMTRLAIAKIAIILSGNDVKDTVMTKKIFQDLPAGQNSDHAWVRAIMNTAYSLGYIGSESGYANPDKAATRAEALAILTRASKIFDGKTYKVDKFNDIADNAWYKDLIGFTEDKINIEGRQYRRFYPNEIITRAESSKLAIELAKMMSWIKEDKELYDPLKNL